MTKLNENDLSKASGGVDINQYKYHIRRTDWVYNNAEKTVIVDVEESIDTDDPETYVRVRYKTGQSVSTRTMEDGIIQMKISHIIERYKEYGGILHEMPNI